jgi:hypothetical protein
MYERVLRSHLHAFDAEAEQGSTDQQLDAVYAFFMFCFHLKDWIKSDTAVPAPVREAVEDYVGSSAPLTRAQEVTNSVKHLVRTHGETARVGVEGDTLGGTFVLGTSRLGGRIVIRGHNGIEDAKQIADECLDAWADFIGGHRLA